MSNLTDYALPKAHDGAAEEQAVDRRTEGRLQVNVPVTVTVLGMFSEGIMQSKVLDVSGRGMRVCLPLPIAVGSAVQVETSDSLYLGEACFSEPSENGYIVGLTLSHSLNALAELGRLHRTLMDEEADTQNSKGRRTSLK